MNKIAVERRTLIYIVRVMVFVSWYRITHVVPEKGRKTVVTFHYETNAP